MKRLRYLKIFVLFGFCFSVTGYIGFACSHETVQVPAPHEASVPNEPSFCTLHQSFAQSTTVSGLAQFNIRQSTSLGLQDEILGGPIRYAELVVTDVAGNSIQCAETDGTGHYVISVPSDQKLILTVFSRALNSYVQASVLDSPTTNRAHGVSMALVASGATMTLPNLIATAKNDLTGGAFNILENITRANDSLRYYICGSTSTACGAFSVAPKVTAYWTKGVNPYVYFGGDASSGLSFYIPGSDKLYILGGINGDVDSTDTDHFDDAVITHEYGHFIEDHYATTDSPGGSHDGSRVLDARLTWGEGWADFFSSAMRGDRIYRDTYGNKDGLTGCYFNYDIELNSNFGSKLDIPTTNGEGNFREFAITRALWDIIDPVAPTGTSVGGNGGFSDDNRAAVVGTTPDNTTQPFLELWTSFTGLANPNTTFRNVGLFLSGTSNTTANSNAVAFQKIFSNLNDYAKPLPTISSACVGTDISANDPVTAQGGGLCNPGQHHPWCSNQFYSNDFYDVNVDGSFTKIALKRISGAAQLELFLYKNKYVFENYSDVVASNLNDFSVSDTKEIDVSTLSPGHYMLNVSVNTDGASNPGTSRYQLFVDGAQVCP